MAIGLASAIALLVVTATVLMHYELLRGTSRLIPLLAIPPRTRIIIVIGGAFVAHLLEISLYAVVFWSMQDHLGLGTVVGHLEGGALDFFYFSTANFTTLGVGDLHATGPMRIVASIQSLNGLVLIGWSASFTYLAMERFWELHRHPGRQPR
jgi:hypothetical protein